MYEVISGTFISKETCMALAYELKQRMDLDYNVEWKDPYWQLRMRQTFNTLEEARNTIKRLGMSNRIFPPSYIIERSKTCGQ